MAETLHCDPHVAAGFLQTNKDDIIHNEALVNVVTGNLDKASAVLANAKCPCKSYLKAIVAARKGDNTAAKQLLEVAKKDEKLAKRAEKDIEFAKL